MDGMIAIADAIDRIAGDRHQRMSDADKLEVDDVLEAAWEWDHGRLPIEAFANVGTIVSPGTKRPSSSYTRYLAMLSTPIPDLRRASLRRAVDEVLRLQGLVITTKGVFAPADIVGITIHRAPDPWLEQEAA